MLQLEKLESNEVLEIKKQEQDLNPVVLSGSMLLQSTENHVLFKELEKYEKIDNENYLYGEKLNKHITVLNASLINGTYLVLGTGLMMLNQTMSTVLLGISVGILNVNLPELTKVKRLKNMWKKVTNFQHLIFLQTCELILQTDNHRRAEKKISIRFMGIFPHIA